MCYINIIYYVAIGMSFSADILTDTNILHPLFVKTTDFNGYWAIYVATHLEFYFT